MKTRLTTFIAFLFLLWTSVQSVFWASWNLINLNSASEKPQTLREMQEVNQDLEQEQQNLEFKWVTFRSTSALWDFLKKDLSDLEREELEMIVVNYSKKIERLEKKIETTQEDTEILQKLRKDVLLLKQNFYKNLIVYMQVEKLNDFLRYINLDLSYREKSKDVAIELDRKNIERNERVAEIQEKIKDNTKRLHNQIKLKIMRRVWEKLDSFVSQKKFQSLSNQGRIQIFEKLIEKLSQKKQKLKSTSEATSFLEEKLLIYEIVEKMLFSYLEKWK